MPQVGVGVAESPVAAVSWLLFVGSSMHIASTGWLFSARELRAHVTRHPGRYLWVPGALIGVAAVLAVLMSHERLNELLLLYFGWQFWHYHRQNYGLAALAAASQRVPAVKPMERRALVATGCGGVLAVLSQPALLQLRGADLLRPAFALAVTLFLVGSCGGFIALLRRPRNERPTVFCGGYIMALLFFAPVFIFGSPYAAVGTLVIVHGLQYLVLTGLVSTGDRHGSGRFRAATFLCCGAIAAGALLSFASHLHSSGPWGRPLYGAYLGVVMSHFVVDAGVWRLRDPARRSFIAARVPFLLPTRVSDASDTDIRSTA